MGEASPSGAETLQGVVNDIQQNQADRPLGPSRPGSGDQRRARDVANELQQQMQGDSAAPAGEGQQSGNININIGGPGGQRPAPQAAMHQPATAQRQVQQNQPSGRTQPRLKAGTLLTIGLAETTRKTLLGV